MTTELKTLLDDAAAGTTAGLRIDLAVARRRALERRREVRRRAASVMATAVAVAATIALAAVLLPGSSPKAIQPAAGVSGLPDHWFYSPPWTPPVTRHPMPAASMIVSSNLTTGLAYNPVTGPVLVSADGKHYASLPWSTNDSLVTLSRDGTRVAWVTQDTGAPVVHRIVLATGEQRNFPFKGPRPVRQLVWAGELLYAVRTTDTVVVSRENTLVVCECTNLPLASDAQGRLLQPTPTANHQVPAATVNEGLSETYSKPDAIVTGKAVASPDGTQVAMVVHDEKNQYFLSIKGPGGRQIQMLGTDPVTGAQALGWGPGGVVVRTTTTSPTLGPARSLRLYDPVSGAFRIVAKPTSTSSDVLAVADDLVTPATLPGVRPQFSQTDRSHVRFLFGIGWSAFGAYVQAGAFALILLLAGIFWWRTGRRRKTDARDESAQSSGGAGQAGDGG